MPTAVPRPESRHVNTAVTREPEPPIPTNTISTIIPDERSPESNSKQMTQSREPDTPTPRPTSTSVPPPNTSTTDVEEAAWIAGKIVKFQSAIHHLKLDATARMTAVQQTELKIQEVQNADRGLDQQREDEIREIVERYQRKRETLMERFNELEKTREAEMEALNRNEAEVRRKEDGIKRFQAVVDYFNDLNDGY